MKHLTKALFAFLLMPLFSLAQSNYKPGYVVTLKGDTLRGYIDYKEWDRNPTKISFKNNLNTSDVVSYSVKNATAFTVNKLESYQRFIVSVSQDVVEETKIETKLDTSKITDTVFLRISNAGKNITLFTYTDNIKEHFYYLDKDATQPIELIYHAYLNEESNAIQYIKLFRTQLENVAQKHKIPDDVIYKIIAAEYSEPDLIKVAEDINGPSSKQYSQETISGARWFIGIGSSDNKLTFEGYANPFPNSKPKDVYSPKITGGLDFFPNKTVQRFFIRIEYSFEINKYNVVSNDGSPYLPSVSTFNFTQYNNSLMPQVILNVFNKDSFKLFIGAGIGLNLSAYNHYQTITQYSQSFNSPSINDKYPLLSQFWASFPLSAGMSFNKKIELNFRYIPGTSLTDYNSFSGAVTSYQFGINYLFGK